MTFCRTRIFRIELGIGNAVKAHGAVSRRHHAKDNQDDDAGCFVGAHIAKAVRRNPHGTKRKRHRK